MTRYEELAWTTLSLVKRHLYRRLATPLNQALGRLAIARHLSDAGEIKSQVAQAEQSLEIALNLLKAWAVLIHVKSGGVIRRDQRRLIAPDGLPAWLVDHLKGLTSFQNATTRPVFVQAETFYESLILISLVSGRVGTLKKLVIADSLDDEQRVSVRAIFEPPAGGPYASLNVLYKRFSAPAPAEQETGFQLQVLQELLRLNGAALRLQNNQRSGEQALAARLWVTAFADEALGESSTQARATQSVDEVQASMLAQFLRTVPEQITAAAVEVMDHAPEAAPHAAPTIIPPPAEGAELPDLVIPEPPIDNDADTLILPPVGFHERLAALFNAPEPDPNAENDGDTVILDAQSFRERLAELTSSLAGPESKPVANPFIHPPAPGTIQHVEAENASDTLIVPPADYQRRLGAQRPATPSAPEHGDQDRSAPTN